MPPEPARSAEKVRNPWVTRNGQVYGLNDWVVERKDPPLKGDDHTIRTHRRDMARRIARLLNADEAALIGGADNGS